MYQVVNREKNADKLKEVPHKDFLDLSVVYRIYLPKNVCSKIGNGVGSGNGNGLTPEASVLVNNSLIKSAGIKKSELDAAARKNTEKNGLTIRPMNLVMKQIFGEFDEENDAENDEENGGDDNNCSASCTKKKNIVIDPEAPGMHVLSNFTGQHGASVILFPEILSELADGLGDNLFILPSSIHEVLGVPATGMKANDLRAMVRSINQTEVAPEERLSDEVYFFDRELKELSLVPEC